MKSVPSVEYKKKVLACVILDVAWMIIETSGRRDDYSTTHTHHDGKEGGWLSL